jgi:hypothetical protein
MKGNRTQVEFLFTHYGEGRILMEGGCLSEYRFGQSDFSNIVISVSKGLINQLADGCTIYYFTSKQKEKFIKVIEKYKIVNK